MKYDVKSPYGLDSVELIRYRPYKKMIVLGEEDKLLLLEESKKPKKPNNINGKDGKRYYIEWNDGNNDDHIFAYLLHYDDERKRFEDGYVSYYFYTETQASSWVEYMLKIKPNMDAVIIEETKINNQWMITHQRHMFL